MNRVQVKVECMAGYKGDEEPRCVWVDGSRHEVAGIRDRWYDPNGDAFRVRTASGILMLIQHKTEDDTWWLLQQETLDS